MGKPALLKGWEKELFLGKQHKDLLLKDFIKKIQ